MCCKYTGKYLCVYEAPLSYKNIYFPFLSIRKQEIFLTKKMSFFQKKKSQIQCRFSDFQSTPPSLQKLLISSHFREILADVYSCGLYFIMAACFPIHPLHFTVFSGTAWSVCLHTNISPGILLWKCWRPAWKQIQNDETSFRCPCKKEGHQCRFQSMDWICPPRVSTRLELL